MLNRKNNVGRDVYFVDGSRTPFLKARGKPGPFSASDLAVNASRSLLLRQPFPPSALDEVVTGCVMPSADETNIARVIALRLGCGMQVPAYTVQRNCGSGLQALDNAAEDIASGRCDLVLAGGTDAMSHAPLLFNRLMVNWLASWYAAKGVGARLKTLTKFRLGYLAPVIALLRGLTDPIVNLSMGQTAEVLAYDFGITREEMDAYAMQSHQRIAAAYDKGEMNEVVTLYDDEGHFYNEDDGMRRDSSMEKLATLKPFFDKPYGMVTPGNSSQVTDGAAFLLLASKDAVKKYNLPVLGKLIDIQWSALDPSIMGLGPAHAIAHLLQRNTLTLNDIAFMEINEAFAAQVLACLKVWQDADYCRKQLGLNAALGEYDMNRLNVDGGAIAVGHPVGASGARVVLHLLHVLRRNQAKQGIASMCIGGGQGGAALIENVSEVK